MPAYLAYTSADAKKRQHLARQFQHARSQHDARVNDFGRENATQLFQRLRDGGMEANALGLDLTELQRKRSGSLLHDVDALAGLRLLNMQSSPLEVALLRCDQPLQRNRCSERTAAAATGLVSEARHEARMVRQLRELGFYATSSWGLNLTALAEQAESNLQRAAAASPLSASALARGRPLSSFEPLAAMQPLLRNASLQRVITAFFGGPARYDGFNLIRYPPQFNGDFPAGEWHHDRCGRRLKLFIYIGDVTDASHPTQLATQSHNTIYYTHGEVSAR